MQDDTAYAEYNWSIPGILSDLEEGKSLYELARLDLIYPITNLTYWAEEYGVYEVVEDVKKEIEDVIQDVVDQAEISTDDQQYIRDAADVFEELQNAILQMILDLNSTEPLPMGELDSLIRNLTDLGSQEPSISSDINALVVLAEDVNATANSFISSVDDAVLYADTYNSSLYYEGTMGIRDTIDSALNLAEAAVDYIDGQGTDDFLEAYDAGADQLIGVIDLFVNYTVCFVEEDLGATTPLYHIYEATINELCYKVLDPYNALWSGIGLVLLAFVPLLMLSCGLEGLYRRKRDEERPRRFADISYKKAKKGKKNKKGKSAEEDSEPVVVEMRHISD